MLRLMTTCIHGGTCGLGMMPPLCQLDHWTGAHRGSRGKWGHRGKWGTPVLTAIPLKVESTGQEKKELDHPKERQNYSNTPVRKLGGSVQASFSMSQAKQRFCYERLPRGTRGNLLAPFVLHCIGRSVDRRVTQATTMLTLAQGGTGPGIFIVTSKGRDYTHLKGIPMCPSPTIYLYIYLSSPYLSNRNCRNFNSSLLSNFMRITEEN